MRALQLDEAELNFDVRMKAASFSTEYTKHVSVRMYTVTKAHGPSKSLSLLDRAHKVHGWLSVFCSPAHRIAQDCKEATPARRKY